MKAVTHHFATFLKYNSYISLLEDCHYDKDNRK